MRAVIILGWIFAVAVGIFGALAGKAFSAIAFTPYFYSAVICSALTLAFSFPLFELENIPHYIKQALSPSKAKPKAVADKMLVNAKIAKARGDIAIEEIAGECRDSFMKTALLIYLDKKKPDEVAAYVDDMVGFIEGKSKRMRVFFTRGIVLFLFFGVAFSAAQFAFTYAEKGIYGAFVPAGITLLYCVTVGCLIFLPVLISLKKSAAAETVKMRVIRTGIVAISDRTSINELEEELLLVVNEAHKRKNKHIVKDNNDLS